MKHWLYLFWIGVLIASCTENTLSTPSRTIASRNLKSCPQLFIQLFKPLRDETVYPQMYFIMPRINGRGTLDDLTNELADFHDMGVERLWVGSVHPQKKVSQEIQKIWGAHDHGYWCSNHGTVDPNLGGIPALKKLLKRAQEFDIDIMLDTPINHFGYGDSFIIDGKTIFANDSRYFRIFDGNSNAVLKDLCQRLDGASGRREILALQKEIIKYPLADLPSFNHHNEEIASYLINSYKNFIDMGVTSFRLDAVKHIPFDFVGRFINELSEYGAQQGRQIEFLIELLVHGRYQMEVLSQDLLRFVDNTANVKLLDFPGAAGIRGIIYPDYHFSSLRELSQWQSKMRTSSSQFVPFLENHDFETPLPQGFIRKLAYTISEFINDKPTLLFHGHEVAGDSAGHSLSRKIIDHVDAEGEIAVLIKKVRSAMTGGEVNFSHTSKDFLVASRQKTYLIANKSLFEEFTFENPLHGNYKIITSHGNIKINRANIRMAPQAFALITTP